ncbi:hypothetical protein J4226_04145 [Candidatus Pacearchaeota archaeon]|nr:hypothetical protein [Candidatus Pacearchaeota archaeon]
MKITKNSICISGGKSLANIVYSSEIVSKANPIEDSLQKYTSNNENYKKPYTLNKIDIYV